MAGSQSRVLIIAQCKAFALYQEEHSQWCSFEGLPEATKSLPELVVIVPTSLWGNYNWIKIFDVKIKISGTPTAPPQCPKSKWKAVFT